MWRPATSDDEQFSTLAALGQVFARRRIQDTVAHGNIRE
jgi:hypothetical protein